MNITDFASADQIRDWLLADKCIDIKRGHVVTLTDVLDSIRDADRHRIDREILRNACNGGLMLKVAIHKKAQEKAQELYDEHIAEDAA